jgi:hypothetical protein
MFAAQPATFTVFSYVQVQPPSHLLFGEVVEGHLPGQHLVHDDRVAVHVRRSAQPVLSHQLQMGSISRVQTGGRILQHVLLPDHMTSVQGTASAQESMCSAQVLP